MNKGLFVQTDRPKELAELLLQIDEKAVGYDFKEMKLFRWQEKFFFMDCEEDTRAVILYNVNDEKWIEGFFHFITNGIHVEKQGKSVFQIMPKIIVLSQLREAKVMMGHSFDRRFKLIDLTSFDIEAQSTEL